MLELASYPGPFRGAEKRAWYILHAHVLFSLKKQGIQLSSSFHYHKLFIHSIYHIMLTFDIEKCKPFNDPSGRFSLRSILLEMYGKSYAYANSGYQAISLLPLKGDGYEANVGMCCFVSYSQIKYVYLPITCTLQMAQVSHSTSHCHIATAFHFFKVNIGPAGALEGFDLETFSFSSLFTSRCSPAGEGSSICIL